MDKNRLFKIYIIYVIFFLPSLKFQFENNPNEKRKNEITIEKI